MRIPSTSVALALTLAGCSARDVAPGSARTFWVGEAGAARVLAVSDDGRVLSVAAAAPALDAPVRALARRADGTVVILQEVSSGAAPGVVVGPDGARLATLAATAGGAPLFDASQPPWAAAEAADGRIWVTGRAAPVLFERSGAFAKTAAPLPFATRGVAALPDGRVLVTSSPDGAALYAADGSAWTQVTISLGAAYSGVDAIAARPGGGLVLAVLRHGVTTDGVLVDVALGPGSLAAAGNPDLSAALPTLPSAIDVAADSVVAGPALGPLAAPACAEALSPDLRVRSGCIAPGAHRGAVRMR